MKFTCTQENLVRGLAHVSHVTGKSVTLPILKNALLTADADSITFSATNLELGVTTAVRGKVDAPGSFTVNARVLLDYVSLLPAGNVTLELIGADLQVTSQGSKTTLKGMPADDFPVIPKVTDGVRFALPTGKLKASLSQSIFAVAADDARPEISGVLFHLHGSVMTLAATDSYRLSEVHVPMTTIKEEQRAIVPSRSLAELLRLLPENGDVACTIGENQVGVVADGVELVTRLIEGQFPDYSQIIPASFTSTLTLETSTFAKMLRQVSLFCRSGINDVTLAYDESGARLTAANAQVGASDVALPATLEGRGGSIGFNWRFLLDGLSVVGTDSVALQLNDEKGPGLLTPIDPPKDAPAFRYLIMPIRQ